MRPRSTSSILFFAALSAVAQLPQGGAGSGTDTAATFTKQWCVRCHSGPEPEGSLDFERTPLASIPDPARLSRIRARLAVGEMPPAEEPKPPPAERRRIIDWLDAKLAALPPPESRPGGAAPAVRRLSRTEYENTIRDLCDVSIDAARLFPVDDAGYGFDNVAGALRVSPLLFERYVRVAESIAEQAIDAEDPHHPAVKRFEAEKMACPLNPSTRDKTFRVLYSNGELSQKVVLPRDGDYEIRARAFGDQAGPEAPRMTFEVDEHEVASFAVAESRPTKEAKAARARLRGGPHLLSVAFTNDYYAPDAPDPHQRDRNLLVDWVEISGPLDVRPKPALEQALRRDDRPDASTAERFRATLGPFLARAWRRPVAAADLDRVVAMAVKAVEDGARFERGLQLGVEAALLSPRFIFRLELDPPGAESRAAAHRPLDGFELAARLSYFLWATAPDERLTALATSGALTAAGTITAEVRRMLDDPRASSLATNFAPQWLEVRNLADVTPDAKRFPEFDEELRGAMAREAELFFEAVLREKRSIWTLIDSDFTFVNERLAKHYGIGGVRGSHFRRVRIAGGQRGGLITQAGVQTVTANPTRTSPVKRGKWILENILDAATPPPPPGAGALEENTPDSKPATMRERLDRHRRNPSCAACHVRLDALGFALENYDPIGRWRTADESGPVDVGGTLPDGRAVHSPDELRLVLRSDDAFLRCLAKKLFVYALGREPTESDRESLRTLVAGLPRPDPTLEDLIVALVGQDAFRQRAAE